MNIYKLKEKYKLYKEKRSLVDSLYEEYKRKAERGKISAIMIEEDIKEIQEELYKLREELFDHLIESSLAEMQVFATWNFFE